MAEKKQFFIPKNYDKKFEFIPGISGLQHLVFIPVGAAVYLMAAHLDFSFSNKVIIAGIMLGLPYILISTKPVRKNVSMYKHLWWKLKFLNRQRTFKYRKVGYDTDVQYSLEIEKTEIQTREGITGSQNSQEINTGFNTTEGSSGWNNDHSGKSSSPVPESVGN